MKELAELVVMNYSIHPRDGKPYQYLRRERRHFEDSCEIIPNQRYTDDVLHKLGLEGCKPAATPSVVGEKFQEGDDEPLPRETAEAYRSSVGILIYLSVDR